MPDSTDLLLDNTNTLLGTDLPTESEVSKASEYLKQWLVYLDKNEDKDPAAPKLATSLRTLLTLVEDPRGIAVDKLLLVLKSLKEQVLAIPPEEPGSAPDPTTGQRPRRKHYGAISQLGGNLSHLVP